MFQAFVGRNLLGSFVAINKKVEASCVHGLDDISQILWSFNFLQVSKVSLLEYCRRQQGGPRKAVNTFIFFFFAVANVSQNKEGLVGVPCGAETKL